MEAVAEATPPHSNLYMYGDVLVLLKRCYRTTDRYDKEQTSPLASLKASASTCLAVLSKRTGLSHRSLDNASLAVAMA